MSWSETHQSFVRIGEDGIDLTLTNEEVHALHQRGQLVIDQDALHPEVAALRAKSKVRHIVETDPEALSHAAWKQAYCDEMIRLMAEDPNIRRDDESMKDNVKILHDRIYDRKELAQSPNGRAGRLLPMRRRPAGSQVRKWLTKYLRHNCDPLCLIDGRKTNSGNRDQRFAPEIERMLDDLIPAYYIHRDRPSAAKVHDKIGKAIVAFAPHVAVGPDGKANIPTLRTIQRRIAKLNKVEVCVARYGYATARKLYGATHLGVKVVRPMQRVEMDEWKVNLFNLMEDSGVIETLSPEQRASIPVDRCWATCAIDVATRCIVALHLSPRAPSAASALRGLEMIVSDKTEIAQWANAKNPWYHNGRMELLVTDNGPGYIADEFQTAAASVARARATAPAGFPEMRATIERFFGTCSTMLMPYLPGRTFANSVEKGEYPGEELASISMDELLTILVRFVVDVYHSTPHDGLGGERPIDAWKRLADLYGVIPSPNLDERRAIFGIELERTITKEGVEFLKLPYQSEDLQNIWIDKHLNPVRIRVDQFDVGKLSVHDGDGWITVKCQIDEVDTFTVAEWVDFLKLQRAYHAENAIIYRDTIGAALTAIERTATTSLQRMGLPLGHFTAEDLDKIDRDTKLVFRLNAPRSAPEEDLLGVTDDDRTGGMEGDKLSPPIPHHKPKRQKTPKEKPVSGPSQVSTFGEKSSWKTKKS